ncbi:MAG: DUF1553 domain-containing protein [Planctomycetaceae bacterium]
MSRLASFVLALFLATPVAAGGPDFARDVYPLFKRHCVECHGADVVEGDLRLDDRKAFLAGGASGPLVDADDPAASELLRRVELPADDPEHMPATGDSLSAKEVERLRAWIEAGAKWPDDFDAGKHWAYEAPVRPVPPDVADDGWARNPIDRFVLARLEAEGAKASAEADGYTLIRRVSLDLTGLPPTPEEVDAFLADDAPGAYERLVDRLLASPAFGEKWATSWLDVARYADSHGFQRDDLRSVWPYRDWVIGALNSNMPFDRFTIEQLAGDLLPEATPDQLIATGFHRCTTANVEAGSEPEETRVNQVLDRVNTTATVWLGSTLECAQCHDHKYDPFTQRDYYALFAYFNSTEIEAKRSNPKVPGSIKFLGPTMPLPESPEFDERRDELTESLARMEQRIERMKESSDDEKKMKPLLKRRDKLAKRLEKLKPPSTLVMQELETPRDTFVFQRGVYTSLGEEVTAATPRVLPPADGPADRLTLARWLVSRDNPLTARVVVNRWWLELFGNGLVTTPEDFGVKGAPPTHPELFDWLAVEFMESVWDRKHVLRLIVTSATYRQSSAVSSELLERDPENTLIARGPRFRLDAETVRDQALAIAGLLSHKQQGPPVRPWQPEGLWTKVGGVAEDKKYVVSPGEDAYRRGVYVVLKRGSPYPSFTTFDATPRLTCTVARDRSNTPLQALVLLNDPVYVEAAMAFAQRIVSETPDAGLDDRLRYAVKACLCRAPSDEELTVLRSLYDDQYESAAREPKRTEMLLKNAAVAGTADKPAAPDPAASTATPNELAAWYAVATALLNLDEAITKE